MCPKRLIVHINHVILAKGHPRRHLIHKFWARKPHNVVQKYIEHYSRKNEIVLDPFVGSGVTAIEALVLERKAIAIDLNPIATFITEMVAKPADIEDIEEAYEKIKHEVRTKIRDLYVTTCSKCHQKASIIVSVWKRGKTQPLELRYYCPSCKKKRSKPPSKEDLQKLERISTMKIPYWVPDVALRYPNGKEYKEGTHVEEESTISSLFTKRNLVALSILYHEIEALSDSEIRDFMKFAFTSMVHLASKMTPDRPTRPYSSFWSQQRYWTPPRFLESNVWSLFRSAILGRQGLVKGKEDSNEAINKYKKAKQFDDLKNEANILISTQSALDLSNIPDNGVDYVFTDPPYGGDIQYFELSTLWLAWLRGEHNDRRFNLDWWQDEITINSEQKKDFDYYHRCLHVAFREVYRVLKPRRFLTVTFHNADVKVYNSIIRAVIFAGFELDKIIYQPPARASAKALLQPYGSAIGDYYIRFRKLEAPIGKVEEREIDEERAKAIVLEGIKRILMERGEHSSLTDILKGHTLIYNELRKHGYRFFGANPESISKVLKENKNKEFVFLKGQGWYFKEPTKYHLESPLTERVEIAILDTLHRKIATFDDLLQDIYLTFTNAQTPSEDSVKHIVEEYARPEGGKWKLKPQVKEREKEHGQMIGFLAELGKKCGFKTWIGTNEQSYLYAKKPLSELCDFEKLSLIDLGPDDINKYVKLIDILWIKDGKVSFAFEVEYSTAITDAFMRCSVIPESHKAQRFIVIPEEREKFMYRKLNSPLLKERMEKEGWRVMFFKDLTEFYNKNEKKHTLDPQQILAIATLPVEEREKQATMDCFTAE
jgi:16S rRNA G966 N2-methylase RsmD